MYVEPTTLSDIVRLIEEVLEEHYGVDPVSLMQAAGVAAERAEISGSRVDRAAVMRLWELAAAATGDQSIGLEIGSRIRATTFYALSVAFLTCDTLQDSVDLICRYYRVITNVPLKLDVVAEGDAVILRIKYSDPKYPFLPIPFDSFIASIVGLCRLASTPDFHPRKVRIRIEDCGRRADYERIFGAPVEFSAGVNELIFDRAEMQKPLPGRSVDILDATDKVLDDYLAALSPDQVASEVKRLLLSLLPTGSFSQDAIAHKMHMSRSTLQRRLRDENTNYQELVDTTRRSLAIGYVKGHGHSLSHVAFLLGFADQSNFSRAFRRWTGQSPKVYRNAISSGGDV
jgi:AraC-like DNA-binding protein